MFYDIHDTSNSDIAKKTDAERDVATQLREITRSINTLYQWLRAACVMLVVVLLFMVLGPILGPYLYVFITHTLLGF